jgi:hypothetical protein
MEQSNIFFEEDAAKIMISYELFKISMLKILEQSGHASMRLYDV